MAKESKGIIIGTERAYRSSRLSFSVSSVPSAVGAQATQAAEREREREQLRCKGVNS